MYRGVREVAALVIWKVIFFDIVMVSPLNKCVRYLLYLIVLACPNIEQEVSIQFSNILTYSILSPTSDINSCGSLTSGSWSRSWKSSKIVGILSRWLLNGSSKIAVKMIIERF